MNTATEESPSATIEASRRTACALCLQDCPTQAEDVLRAALVQWPGNLDLQSDLASLLVAAGRPAEAETLALQALDTDALHLPSLYALACAVSALGQEARAHEHWTSLCEGAVGRALAQRYPDMAAHATVESARSRRAPPTRWTGQGPQKYDLSHLVQAPDQDVAGPIQDDEALLLYATIRTMRLRRILEVGGLDGYSARNFLAALGDEPGAALYTVDIHPVPCQGPLHHVITSDCAQIEGQHLHHMPLDLIFFDAHVVEPQMRLLDRLVDGGYVQRHTVIALHDTNIHAVRRADFVYPIEDADGSFGFVHRPEERQMVNELHSRGWDAICFHAEPARCDTLLNMRHGLTLMRRFHELRT